MRKLLVSSLVAISAITAIPAQADVSTFVAGTAGAVGGAALCSEIGDGNGQIIAMAACAVIGSKIAENMVKPRQQRYPQDVEIRQGNYPNGGYATGGYDYERNRVLIDLTAQPQEIKDLVDARIKEGVRTTTIPQVGIHFMKFCGKYELTKISEQAETYAKWLNSPYKGNLV